MQKDKLFSEKITLVAQALALFALFMTLQLYLLPALLMGILVFQSVHHGAAGLSRIGVLPRIARIFLLVLILGVILAGFAGGIASLVPYLRGDSESLVALLQRMADVVDTARSRLPGWARQYLPDSMVDWQAAIATWLRGNAAQISLIGRDIGMFVLHLFMGAVIGGLIAVSNKTQKKSDGPLAQALTDRAKFLGRAFQNVVFSQVRISALNTFLTAIFLVVVMPVAVSPLPFTKTIIIVTFLVGLLPIIGNIISNTVIFLIALSISSTAAVGALLFLIFIHKLEYFVNARIIGSQIRARAWELLIAMLVMEAAFGIPGLVAAPIYYAYIKEELSARGWI